MDNGWAARLDILRNNAETMLLEPLRRHGWRAVVEQEVERGEYLILSAERGSHRRTLALLYSSATSNAVFKALETEVGQTLVNSELYRIEEYAHGLTKPVLTVKDFHSVLIEWNRETSDGKFAPAAVKEGATDEEEEVNDHRLLLSEAPIDAVWLRLRQLQSVRLAEKLIADRANRTDTHLEQIVLKSKAQGVSFALRNAGDYFFASQSRNVSQRILNLYYGTMAFAFAEMLANPSGPSTLAQIEDSTKQGHGLYTIDGRTADLQDVVVGVIRSGFFPSWMRSLGVDANWFPQAKARTFAAIEAQPLGSWLTLEALFARIPEISDLFLDIFDAPTLWLHPAHDMMANQGAFGLSGTTRTYGVFTDLSGQLDLDDVATFPGPISEIRRLASKGRPRRFGVAVDHEGLATWWDALPIHTSPLGRTALIKPIFNDVVQYRAVCFVLLYALSIIVRYRPSVWRRVQEGDLDHMRVLIEAFLAVVERVLPEQFLASVSGNRIFAKQPGSFF